MARFVHLLLVGDATIEKVGGLLLLRLRSGLFEPRWGGSGYLPGTLECLGLEPAVEEVEEKGGRAVPQHQRPGVEQALIVGAFDLPPNRLTVDVDQDRRPLGKDDRGWVVVDSDLVRDARSCLVRGKCGLHAVESDDPHGIVEPSLQDTQDLGLELGLCGDLGADPQILVEDDESSLLVDPRAGDEVDHAVGRALLVLL